MNDARAQAQLTLLQNGEALIAGGNQGDALCPAERFSNGKWSLAANLADCVVGGDTAALLPNGDVLIDGGSPDSPVSEFYDPSTNVWQPTSGQQSADITLGPLALLDTGNVLLAGREFGVIGSKSAFLYDPSTNEWTPTGSMPGARARFTLTPLLNGKVLAAGGYLREDFTLTTAALYTP